MEKRTNRVAWGLAAVLGIGTVWGCAPDPYRGRRFVRQEWIAGSRTDNPNNPRCRMVADLIGHHLRKGMARHEAIQLLGKPDRLYTREEFKELTGYSDQDVGLQTVSVAEYTLGQPPGRLDESVFLLKFDRSGRLIAVGPLEY